MRGAWLLVAVAALGACGGKKKQKRASDAAPVEVLNQPIDATGGGVADEVEPNDGMDTATPVGEGGGARGKLDTEGDADYYGLDVSTAGVLSVHVAAVDADTGLEILDASGQLIAKSDRSGKRVEEGLPNLGVTPGRYTIIVRGKKAEVKKPKKPKKGAKPAPDAPEYAPVAYELTTTIAPVAQGAEREPDDDRATANSLILGETVSGYVGWSGDADVYKISLETLGAKNVIDLEVSVVDGSSITLAVADALGKPLVTRKGPKSMALIVPGLAPVIAPGAPPFMYVTVTADRSNPATGYQLRASQQPGAEDVDSEPNDTVETAMPIPAERTELTARWAVADVDCFAVPPSQAARMLTLSVDTQDDADLALDLIVDGKVLAKAETPGKRGTETVTGAVPAGVTAVARVRGADGSAPATYNLKVTEGPPVP